jgi:AcrR family transcriptional regulator
MNRSTKQKTTRDAILDATDRLLAKHGYKKMTIDDLADEVGIGKGSVYLHFESKGDIALSHIDRIIDRLRSNLEEIAASKGSPETRLRKMITERVLYRFDSVQHYSQSLNELLASLRPRLLERRRRYFRDEAEIFAKVLNEGKRSGVFSIKDPSSGAQAVLDATNALLPYSLSAYELGERAELEKKVSNVADLILNGLKKR